LRGEAGVGKSALLEYLIEQAQGCDVARAAGIESEMELAFAGLHQVCAPMLDRVAELPGPQRDALSTEFGLRDGDAPDRFLVGLAVLTLLSDAAEQRPLICVVDDGQWLDGESAQTLAFVARRLGADRVAMVFGMREPSHGHHLTSLPALVIDGLADRDARTLLRSVLTGPLDERVLDRIVAETRGNPLALLELTHAVSPGELAGGFGLPHAPALSHRIEDSFRQRVLSLPPATRLLLLLAAAEPVGDPVLLWRAAEQLGVGVDAAGPAEAADLIAFGAQVRFRHPLVRSAVYRAATREARRDVHRALAEVTDPEIDPDRRAWHRAQAVPALDEEVAGELERSAGRAQARGGLAAAAAFYERAAELTPEPGRRARRALAAAQSKHRAGAPDAALQLLGVAEIGPLDDLDRARVELLRAQMTFSITRGRDAPPLLVKAAKRLESLDPTLARETYLDAFSAALVAGRLADGVGAREVAEAVLAADWSGSTRSPRASDLLLDGLSVLTTKGYVAGAPLLKDGVAAFRDERMSEEDALRWLWLACHVARALGDDANWDEFTHRQEVLARRTGALSVLPLALAERSTMQVYAGKRAVAASLASEADTVSEATGGQANRHGALFLAAYAGRELEVRALLNASRQDVDLRGEGLWLIAAEWTSALLYNSLGRYEEALAAAERLAARPYELGLATWVAPELIEAAVRSGNADRAHGAMQEFAEMADACGTDWALGVEARARALLHEGETAERLHREAIERLGRTRIHVALARAHLLYGEWLRRARRRTDAREELRVAHEMFIENGMDGFAERARRELLATGETVRKRVAETRDELTAQEEQIARLAGDGRTNPEIGAQLFISARTVEWHLRKVYPKLGIKSRRQLRSALSGGGAGAAARVLIASVASCAVPFVHPLF